MGTLKSPLRPSVLSHKSHGVDFFWIFYRTVLFLFWVCPFLFFQRQALEHLPCLRGGPGEILPPHPGERANRMAVTQIHLQGDPLTCSYGRWASTQNQKTGCSIWNATSPPRFLYPPAGSWFHLLPWLWPWGLTQPTLALVFPSWGFRHHSKLRCHAWYQVNSLIIKTEWVSGDSLRNEPWASLAEGVGPRGCKWSALRRSVNYSGAAPNNPHAICWPENECNWHSQVTDWLGADWARLQPRVRCNPSETSTTEEATASPSPSSSK